MIRKFLLHYSKHFVSRYVILAGDILIVIISLVVAYILRFNFDFSDVALWKLPTYLPIVVFISILAFIITRSYVGIIRHTSTDDVWRIFKAVTVTALVLVLLNTLIIVYEWPLKKVLPLGIIIMNALISLFLMIFTRLFAKLIWINLLKGKQKKINVLIFGAGQLGILTKNALLNDLENDYNVVCFVDENPGKIGKTLESIPVSGFEVINSKFLAQKKIDEVIIAILNVDPEKKRQVADPCLQLNIRLKYIPPVGSWINGELQAQQIRNIRIEDLLQREPIHLENSNVLSENRGKVVMVTGAAGSIGSELVRQLMRQHVKRLILLDQAETPLHDLSLELKNTLLEFNETADRIVADVSDPVRMEWIFNKYKPQSIYHAAAYKHVPVMEENTSEAIRVNVFGTKLLADLSIRYAVEKFVMISTDKAVHPSNVMGATKRLAEIYIQSLSSQQGHNTSFITTRFGNVLGSNGSVIPIFRKQIAEGGPVTVTHPEVIRYFMTIPEACQLVLEAGAMAKGGEIYIFDMGQPVKIVDLARNMIQLAGLHPDEDIKIIYTGLRPGEKLYEELLSTNENTIPTYHPRIMIAKVNPLDHIVVTSSLEKLKIAWEKGDEFEMVRRLKEIVTDFRSNNSIFETLDSALKKEE